jgi:hypothetical protein
LRARIATLGRRVRAVSTVLRLALTLIRVSGACLDGQRLSDAEAKRAVLHTVERARRVLPLPAVFRTLGISPSRYHAWQWAKQGCELTDQPSCPRSTPHRLTAEEIQTINGLVTGADCRHMSVRGLALHAQWIGKVFAHPATRAKRIREHAWRRPRRRVYPPKPTIGVRADRRNGAWHVDCATRLRRDSLGPLLERGRASAFATTARRSPEICRDARRE